MILRPYQQKLEAEIYEAWQLVPNVLAVLPTGGGKTVLFSNILNKHIGASCAIAHRQELVSQISLSLAKYGLKHRIIGPKNVVKWIVQLHMQEVGANFVDPAARCAVAGVDTLLSRKEELAAWGQQVTKWVIDEAHHITVKNKWGKAVALFPNAIGLGVTATAVRADGKGLGRHTDGVMDVIVEGPSPRDLIEAVPEPYLTDYRIFAPPSDFRRQDDKITATGDFNREWMKAESKRSQIMGDVVEHYKRLAPGKLGITFATDVDTATDISAEYNQAGVLAEVVSAKTPDKIRMEILRRFRRREILQLVNVDLFGEGFDLPALEVVSMARPTESYGLYCQQFGRALRVMEGKGRAIIIDHVGNVCRHGLPDTPREWTLERRDRKTRGDIDPDTIPVKTCKVCTGVYEAFYKVCPLCGAEDIPADRSSPEFVDGDLAELDAETLARMRGEVARIDAHPDTIRAKFGHEHTSPAAIGAARNHERRQQAQAVLREAIAIYGGAQNAAGRPKSEGWRRFYHSFGIDVLSAQALGKPAAEDLTGRINKHLRR